MKIVVASRGSRGDVHPLLEIADGLRRRGHEVLLCLPPLFRELAEGRGLRCRCYDESSEQLMRGLRTGWRAMLETYRWFSRNIEEQFELLLPETAEADVLVTTVNEMAGPTIAEHRRIPHFRVALAPVLVGDQTPPLQPLQDLPRPLNRAMWRGINAGLRLGFGEQIDGWRRRLGLAPVGGDFADYFAGYSHTLLAYSATLAPPATGWRHAHSLTGYCFGPDAGGLGAEVERFLAAGPPPVFFGFGSVHVKQQQRVVQTLLAAAARARCRVLLHRGWWDLGAGTALPDHVHAVGDLPHGLLFPRVAGVAHHGGSGTTHMAARCGRPQLMMPQIVDQFFWGHRAHAMGIGPAPIPPRKLTVPALADALRSLAAPSIYTQRAADVARRMRAEIGLPAAIAAIEAPCEAQDALDRHRGLEQQRAVLV